MRYDAWGSTLDAWTAGAGSTATPWRFQGRLDVSPDADEPLYDFGARMYRPSGGTFTQLDTYAGTAQNPLSMNRFLYAHANPTTLIDPTGHCVTCPPAIDGYVPLPKQGKNGAVYAAAAQKQASTVASQAASAANPANTASAMAAAAQRARDRIDQAQELARHRQFAVRIDEQRQAYRASAASNDGVHAFLDGCGLLSVLGTFCDIGNAALYALEGDAFNAGLSMAAIVPGASEAIGGIRLGARYGDDVLGAVAGVGRQADDLSAGTQPYRGGRYGDLDAPPGIQRHHAPADSVSPLSRGDGPAIQMDVTDHMQTASWGRSASAQAYRAEQRALIDAGLIDDAILMDILDIRAKFGPKYDDALLQMIGSLD